jgi:hypothetical protein
MTLHIKERYDIFFEFKYFRPIIIRYKEKQKTTIASESISTLLGVTLSELGVLIDFFEEYIRNNGGFGYDETIPYRIADDI